MGTPTAADGIPRGANQLATGVILSNKNKNGRTKSVREQRDMVIPWFFTTSGDRISHPNGTDKIAYADHVICLFIAKSTMMQVMIEITQATEKDRNIALLYLTIIDLLKIACPDISDLPSAPDF